MGRTYRRIYDTRIKKAIIGLAIPLIMGIFYFLFLLGDINIVAVSGDVACGSEEIPCYAYINFTMNKDYIYIYPSEEWLFYTETPLKVLEFQVRDRRFKTGWRTENLATPSAYCQRTGCKYAFRFYKTKGLWEVRIKAIKVDPTKDIKWGFGPVDPVWLGLKIGIEFNATSQVYHIWNVQHDYYVNATSGIQITNHFQDYWTHNIVCANLLLQNNWDLFCTDTLSLTWSTSTDNLTYANLTGVGSVASKGFKANITLKYHIGSNDPEITIIPKIENTGNKRIDDSEIIWKVQDIRIDTNETENYIEVTNSTNQTERNILNQSNLNLSYDNLSVRKYRLIDRDGSDLFVTWSETFLKNNIELQLNYTLNITSEAGQFNAPVSLILDAGSIEKDDIIEMNFLWVDQDFWTYRITVFDTQGNTDPSDDIIIGDCTLDIAEGNKDEDCGSIANLTMNRTYFLRIKGNTTEADYNYDADAFGDTFIAECDLSTWGISDDSDKQFIINTTIIPIDETGDQDIFFWSTVMDVSITETIADTIDYSVDANISEERQRNIQNVCGGASTEAYVDFVGTESTALDTDPENGGFTFDSKNMASGEHYYWGVIFTVDDDWADGDIDQELFHHEGEGGDDDQEIRWNWTILRSNFWTYRITVFDTQMNTDPTDDLIIGDCTLDIAEGNKDEDCGSIANLTMNRTYFLRIKGNTTEADYNYDADLTADTYIVSVTFTDTNEAWSLFENDGLKQLQIELSGTSVPTDDFGSGDTLNTDVMFWSTAMDASITEAVADAINYSVDGNIAETARPIPANVRGNASDENIVSYRHTESTALDTDPENGGFIFDSKNMNNSEWYYWGVIFTVDDDWADGDIDQELFHHEGEGGDDDQAIKWNWTIVLPALPEIRFADPTPVNDTYTIDFVYVNVTVANATYDIDTCTLEWDAVNESMTLHGSGFSVFCSVNKTGLANANYTYRVFANNTINATNASDTRHANIVTVEDTDLPNITFADPTPVNDTYNTDYAYINVTVSDPTSDIDTCTLEWSAVNESMTLNATGEQDIHCFLNKTGLTTANYTYRVFAADTAGNSNASETRHYDFVSLDSCSYSSGNFVISCSDNCTLNSDVDLSTNELLIIADKGPGNVSIISSTIIGNVSLTFVETTCLLYVESGSKIEPP